ncbi:MAG: TIGR04086 family membrane protein [Clostridia bacterium]|nr:TIGR04086 family membrane protein [Clostridia bacterium]
MYLYSMLAGVGASLAFTLFSLMMGILIFYALPENHYNISWLLNGVLFIAPFLGGVIAGWLVKRRGWIHGGWIGLIYSLVVLIFRMMLFGTTDFLPLILFRDFSLGCMGGICGVNGALYYRRRKKYLREGL